jgi:hypothetical protein
MRIIPFRTGDNYKLTTSTTTLFGINSIGIVAESVVTQDKGIQAIVQIQKM